MLPSGGYLSQSPHTGPFEETQGSRLTPLIDVEMGGVALNDSSQGLQEKLWELRYEGGDFIISADGVPDSVVFSRPGVTDLALAFDQNMAPFVAYMQDGNPRFRWYDPQTSSFEVVDLPSGCIDLRACMDDKRLNQRIRSDIILAYMRNGDLCYRVQRELFGTERILKAGVGGTLTTIGMNTVGRLQFKIIQ